MRRAPSESAAIPDTSTSTGSARRAGSVQRRRELGLERIDRAALLEPRADAGDQAAAADADERPIGNAGVGLDLGGERRRADHDLALVVGVHQQRAAFGRWRARLAARASP